MATCPKSRPQNRKRQHAEADLSQDDLPSLPSKKLKSTREHHSASRFPPPAFWDSLSKVWLTRRALRELDRRNQSESRAHASAPAPRPDRQFSRRKALQRFARHGGPELGDLRGHPEPTAINLAHTMSSKHSSRSSRSSQSRRSKSTNPTSNSASGANTEGSRRRSSAYDADFEQYLIDHSVYPEGYEYPDDRQTPEPGDLDEIRQRLAMPRPSLSPSQFTDSDFQKFKRANTRGIDEGEVMRKVLPMLYGDADIPNKQDLLFTRLESITNETTVVPKPDFYDGARLRDIDKRVREDLGPYIIPTKHPTAPVAPNFFLEAKAPRGGADVAKRQACLDRALGARAMQTLQSYSAGKPVYDNNAYTLSATYHAGNLNMYATHVTPSGPGGSPEYHMTQVRSLSLIDTKERYLEGATHLRNGRHVTTEYRNQFISAANDRARYAEPSTSNYNGVSDTTDAYPVEESQTSAGEIAATLFSNRIEEPEPSEDELTATSFSYPTATSFSYPDKQSDYNNLADITEDSETSEDELAMPTYMKPTPSKKRPSEGSKKAAAKAPRHSTSTFRQKHRFKK